MKLFNTLKPNLIIFDEFFINNNISNLVPLKYYIDNNKCKTIFISTYVDIEVIKLMDDHNDFYINIMRGLNDILGIPDGGVETCTKDQFVELSYKPEHLIDYNDTIYLRKKKLKILDKISKQ